MRPHAGRILMDTLQVYQHILEEVEAGGQAYIICPLVEESAAPGFDDLRAVTEEHARLTREGVLPGHLCGLLHGRMTGEWDWECLSPGEDRGDILGEGKQSSSAMTGTYGASTPGPLPLLPLPWPPKLPLSPLLSSPSACRRGEGGGALRLLLRPGPGPAFHHGGGGGRGRPRRLGHGGGGRGALRPGPAAPAEGPGGPRCAPRHLLPPGLHCGGARQAGGAGLRARRLRGRGAGLSGAGRRRPTGAAPERAEPHAGLQPQGVLAAARCRSLRAGEGSGRHLLARQPQPSGLASRPAGSCAAAPVPGPGPA
uniref:Uncharacterized protein n=1 Tax=Auxenochlorella protothecoides TaxID=3075 RepID=A0A1D2ACR8_AUXPR